MDLRQPAARRRFYLERGLRKSTRGSGSDLVGLMGHPRRVLPIDLSDLLPNIPAVAVGAIAARAYAPERVTGDIDVLVEHDLFTDAQAALYRQGWHTTAKLLFPNSSLGLYGEAFIKDDQRFDLLASDQPWATEALEAPARDQTGFPVVALPYLVLMKIDSARGIDQGDLSRMLGRLSEAQVEEIARIVDRHSGDPQAAEDVRQYARLGKLEWEG